MNKNYLEELRKFFNDNNKILKILDLYEKYDKNDYFESHDFQILDVSFDYNLKDNSSNFSRFSLFWLKKDFLDYLVFLWIDFKYFYLFYDKYKNILKDNFITISFEFSWKNISKIKFYFDILKSNNIILKSISVWNNWIIQEKKDYLDNLNIKKYLWKYKPFDLLYRKDSSWKIISIKYYFRWDTKNNIFLINSLKQKYFVNLLFLNNNYKDEIWLDFDLLWKLQKITFYRWIYKDEKNLNRAYNIKSM